MNISGFTLAREERIQELDSTARLYIHEATGAEILSFTNSDENKVFGVSLRTPPSDSTGVAHILEHSVLCGSEKYPVKEPFVELLKGSLQTFLNAFTYPDKTCYPVASANLQDFRNLTDVYLDAVFFPRITETIFQQEGWHLEPIKGGAYNFKGVVYNEMKGAFSAPESVLARYCLHALFPDTVYSLESGGDPAHIPALTYEDFKAFHANYYHPSNARFFYWGDDPEDERLERLGQTLSRFSRITPNSSIGVQKRLSAPQTLSVPFASSDENDKGMVVVNWLGPDVTDMETGLAFRILEHILLGLPASPLRRALIESGLGEDLAGQGLETELRQLTFDCGLKGIETENAAAVEQLILRTLADLAQNGLAQDMVDAAVNTVEFGLRENNSGRFPVGLSVMLRALTTWLHDADPLAPLRFEGALATIKEASRNKGYFEALITTWLLDNPHRVTVVLTPDTTLDAAMQAKEQERVNAVVSTLDKAGKANIAKQAKVLQKWQQSPDSPENLATIPRLAVADMPKENAEIPTIRFESLHPLALFHPLPTGGIIYAEAAFDLSAVPEYLLPLLSLFGRALLEMGTKKRDFAELGMTIARKTGGMDVDTLFLSDAQDRRPVARLVLDGKCSPDKAADLFALMAEVLSSAVFDDKERFLRMVLEEKARLEHSLVPAGHMVVAARLRAALSGAGMLAELSGGISSLQYIRQLAGRVESDWPSVLQDLEVLRRSIIHRSGLAVNLTALPEQRNALEKYAEDLAAALPEQSVDGASDWFGKVADLPEAEALLLPAQVNYVGKGINLFDNGYAWHGSASVILKYLRTGYLWDQVRVQGGAYGCMCGLDRMSGAFTMVSYRDPNILRTLQSYDAAARHLASHSLSDEELSAAIVGAIGELDTYLLPDAKGTAVLVRLLCGDTEANRQQLREEILGTSARHFKEFGQALEAFSAKGRICALGGKALEKVAAKEGWVREQIL
ncbi:insulinase family protein [Desulfovibrio sp. OttesenSCG-928-G15]|nr:insulinase family protein [Desulfovibrio sp. OttesenSCG-928-G15]